MRRSVLPFIHRLVQHIPPKHFHQVRHYGLFASRRKGKLLPNARKILRQRKRRRPRPSTWLSRRKEHESEPLACPQCGGPMTFYGMLFGPPEVIAAIADIEPSARLPPGCFIRRSRILRHSRVG